ncbi:magnesium-translocating P-type ATPase [Pseudolysinimonas yzui]|uniref:Magnesium-transporting ATPase, P-type 1 n=1 Tax=Pseudolysinimonas yzui TaxID=2708254 RepID=A0A8J3M041_9MICO|nr:magnesium-translocating P-type ATPase [Pseudolysinimonas yzui]GHF07831.1 magnesium-translocating P-type ATPase [Pseudolysinimonas yzui]
MRERAHVVDAEAPAAYWTMPAAVVLHAVGSRDSGLSRAQVQRRRRRDPLDEHRRRPAIRVLVTQFASPVTLVLAAATLIAVALGDIADGMIILAIIVASGLLGFWQEYRADAAVAELLASVRVMSRVLRGGVEHSVPVRDVVRGDVILLSAGDLVPADARLLETDGLQVDASALTGESFPAEKNANAELPEATALAARSTAVQFGSHVVSGTARAVVVATGKQTEFGRVARAVGGPSVRTSFELGIARFGWLLIRLVAVLTTFIFVVNWALGRPVIEALLFALSLAVGITPQMLPAIVALSLAAGARRLAQRHVIVKRLDAIEDLGAITVLCTDKTGTLTSGAAELSAALGPDGEPSERVAALAAANAAAQRGFRNPLDDGILRVHPTEVVALEELPYDFQRKRLSVLVDWSGGPLLITKGAVQSVLPRCVGAAGGEPARWDADRTHIERRADELTAAGNRVLAVATRPRNPAAGPLTVADETQLEFAGLLVFRDPPKPGAREAVATLRAAGVDVRLITGDSVGCARTIATEVGIDAERVVTGADLGDLDSTRLAATLRDVRVFAEVEPLHKERIVAALRANREVVAFLGDGINDAPALHAADVGISVDTAADIAKQAASVVLLDKGLDVVATGVRLGRQTFANTLKYIRLTTSANLGNMASLAIASLVLPFLPLLPRQILLLNFLSDIPAMFIARDAVDEEQSARPIRWHMRSLLRFMLAFGLLSTVFDLITFAVLVVGFGAGETLFQSAWFVMSTLTELAVLFSLRIPRPIWKSQPALGLLIASFAVAAVTAALPFLPPAAELLGLQPPPLTLFAALALVLAGYVAANELLKRRLPHLIG